jgi:hypothetical protein
LDDLELRAARAFSSATTTCSGSGVDMTPSYCVKPRNKKLVLWRCQCGAGSIS